MIAPRLKPLDPPYEPEIARTLDRMMGGSGIEPIKLFRTIAHNPALLDKLRSTGSYLLNFGTVDPLEREIVILRTCARCGCEYEWGVHVAIFSSGVGLSDDQVRATFNDDLSHWTKRQALLLRLTDELHDTATLGADSWGLAAQEWRPDQLVEIVTLAGQYHAVSFVANALGVALEDFAQRFPVTDGAPAKP
jgi:alkylhydroperoxidase family enzyme